MGNVRVNITNVLATIIIKIPPMIHVIIAAGPAIFTVANGLNNHPEPIIPATAEDNRVIVLTDFGNDMFLS